MRILFDLDETLYVGDIVKVAVKQLIEEGNVSIPYSGADAVDFNFSNFPENLRKKIFTLFQDPNIAALHKKPISGAYAFIYHLKMILDYEIGILTARPVQLHEATRYCLWRDFPDIEWNFIGFANQTNGHKASISKRELLQKYSPTHYFDDYLGFCEEAAEVDIENIFLIQNKHTGWNNGLIPKHDRIKPIKSILDFDLRGLYGI